MCTVSKEICRTDNCNAEQTEQSTQNWCLKKHKKEILKSTKKNDGMAYHHHSTGHNIDFDRTEIITEEKNYWRRLIIEGMEIKKLGENRAN